MAVSAYNACLMKATGGGSTYEKLIDVKTTPSLFSEPEKIEVTTLSDSVKKYIKGIQDQETLSFTANYSLVDYEKLLAVTGVQKFALYFGNDGLGSEGKFGFEGELAVSIGEGAVNGSIEMTLYITPTVAPALIKA